MAERWAHLPDGTRLVIRGGAGEADVAAVVIALTAEADRADAPARRPAWLRAALHEGVGGAPATEPSDLRARPGATR